MTGYAITWTTDPPEGVTAAMADPLHMWELRQGPDGSRILAHPSGAELHTDGEAVNGTQHFTAMVHGMPVAKGAMVDRSRYSMQPVKP